MVFNINLERFLVLGVIPARLLLKPGEQPGLEKTASIVKKMRGVADTRF